MCVFTLMKEGFKMLIEDDLEKIKEDLTRYDSAREKLLDSSRKAIRLASWTILQVHRLQFHDAEQNLRSIEETIRELEDDVKVVPSLFRHASILTAYQEYVEAKSLYSLATEDRICTLDEVNVPTDQYLLGLLDLVGELRRTCLEHLKKGDPDSAEEKLTTMEEIYETLLSLDHTSVISNFRHKMDSTRRIIEATRGDVVVERRRWSLEKAIQSLAQSLSRLERKDKNRDDIFTQESQKSSADDG